MTIENTVLSALRCQNARCFDHLFSWFVNTPSYFQHFFLLIWQYFFHFFHSIFFFIFFCKKKMCSSTQYAQSGRKKVNLHAHLYLIPAWCVRKKICIPALTASLSSNPSPPKNAHGMCSSTAYVHFYCARIIFFVFQHCLRAFPLLREAFWTALGCFWAPVVF